MRIGTGYAFDLDTLWLEPFVSYDIVDPDDAWVFGVKSIWKF